MYDIKKISLGEILRDYRKIKKFTLQEVGDKICKSKVTISKYENNEILPDLYTLLELCNILNINITDICEEENEIIEEENPFNKNKLYMYYYTTNKVEGSLIKLQKINDRYKVKFYNEIKKDKKNIGYYYEGDMITDKSVTYFDLNTNSPKVNEKVQIIVNVPWTMDTDVYNGIYTGMTKSGFPIVKKVLISKKELNSLDKYDEQLRFSKEESKNMYKNNALIFRNYNYDEFL